MLTINVVFLYAIDEEHDNCQQKWAFFLIVFESVKREGKYDKYIQAFWSNLHKNNVDFNSMWSKRQLRENERQTVSREYLKVPSQAQFF